MANSLDIDPAKPSQCVEVKFITSSSSSIRRRMETVADLIGKYGQLTFMKRNQDKMISNSDLDTKRRKIGVDIRDPMFVKPERKEESKSAEESKSSKEESTS